MAAWLSRCSAWPSSLGRRLWSKVIIRTCFELSSAAVLGWRTLGRLAVRYPEVPVVFAGSRKFAEEWAYRFLGAAVADHTESF